MKPQQIIWATILGIALLASGATGGWWWAKRTTAAASVTEHPPVAAETPAKVLYWFDPMQPQQHFDKPGKSPFMDMELLPKYAEEETVDTGGTVKIDPALTQNLGLRLATVTRTSLSSPVEATGIVGFNERDVAVVQTWSSGFVKKVWPLAPGELVVAGQPLIELLMPEWTAAQRELLAIKAAGDTELLVAGRERLRLMGMSEALIADVEQRGEPQSSVTLHSPIAGVIQTLDVRAGMAAMSGQTVARINGLGTVWLEVAVPEALAGRIRSGAAAEVRLAGFAGPALKGRVMAILPSLNEASRSLRVRVELPNEDGRLRPGLSAQVVLTGGVTEPALTVPTEAVIRTGKRAVVILAQGQGRFAPVVVTLGGEVGGQTVIKSGLDEGQQVVASGQFLIDSEASFQGVEARMEKMGDGE